MTIREAIMEGAALLRENGSESPFLDASLLASLSLSSDQSSILARYPEAFPVEQSARYRALLGRRASGEPIAYISGRKEFRSLDFEVGPGVLVPRPETEHLVEEALRAVAAILKARPPARTGEPLALHDCCSGSGCVAIALSRELRSLYPSQAFRVTMSDISDQALAYAARNARRLLGSEAGVEKRDLLSGCPAGAFDIVTANPPYLTDNEMEAVRARHEGEPETALCGGADGLGAYRALLPQAIACLATGGCLLVEIGASQGASLRSLMDRTGLAETFIARDLAGLDRVAGGWKRG
jgi:release factor glutamine methyltransferase